MVTMIYNLWIFLNILSTRLKSMSVEDFYSLLMECDYQQRLVEILYVKGNINECYSKVYSEETF